jgi:hypothetical protein
MNKEEVSKKIPDEKSTVKTYRPPDGSTPVVCIHTKPSLMKKLMAFLEHFDRPPQQLFLVFLFFLISRNLHLLKLRKMTLLNFVIV